MSKEKSHQTPKDRHSRIGIGRRDLLLSGTAIVAAAALGGTAAAEPASTHEPGPATPPANGSKPNILVIFGDDIGLTNVSAYSMGLMGYRTPNIDRITKEGMMFTDYYAEQSALPAARPSLPGNALCVPASPKSEFQALRSACKTATSPSPRRSSR